MKLRNLLVAVALVCATSAYASKVNWGTVAATSVTDGTLSITAGTLFLVIGNGIDGTESGNLGALTAFTYGSTTGISGDKWMDSGALTAGEYVRASWVFVNGAATPGGVDQLANYPAIGTTSFYLVAISTDGQTMGWTAAGSVNLVSSTLTAANMRQTGWTLIEAVPEPTSMALLALGVAAVGLRRKFRK